MTATKKLTGVFSAIFTPMDSAGRVNLAMLEAIAEYQIGKGIHGFLPVVPQGKGCC